MFSFLFMACAPEKKRGRHDPAGINERPRARICIRLVELEKLVYLIAKLAIPHF